MTPTACKTPTLAVCIPRWTDAARTEAVEGKPGLQVLTEAGIVSPRRGMLRLEGEGPEKGYCGYCKHIHAHTLRLGPPARRLRQPPNLFFTPRLAVCGHPLSQLGAWTASIPQAGVTQRSPGDQGPSGSLNPDIRGGGHSDQPHQLGLGPETFMQKTHNMHKRASYLDSHTHTQTLD